MTLIDRALNRSRTVIATLLLILVSGVVAFIEIPKEAEPDVNIPIVYVSLHHEGIHSGPRRDCGSTPEVLVCCPS